MAVSKNAQDVVNGACAWAEAIAKDNSFHYGSGKAAYHGGCYFCNSQPKVKKNSNMKGWEKTYCCNPFVFSAFAHGGGDPYMLKKCKKGGNSNTSVFSDNKHFKKIRPKPSFSKLKKGDVLSSDSHWALYLGNNRLAEAAQHDDNKYNSKRWNNSIHVRKISSYGSFNGVHRYIGKGGGNMEVPGGYTPPEQASTDTGAGIDLKQTISKLYRSDNFEYLPQTEEEESTTSKYVTHFKETIQNALNSLDFEPLKTSAFSELLVGEAMEEVDFESNKPKKVAQTAASNLLSYPTMVEAPTIVLDFNGTKIGGYGNSGDKFPNYITSMSVKKINGRINQYTINLTYQVRYNEDPNFIDKLISQTGYTNPLKILYGDSNYPGAYYREESAVIMDARHSEDVSAFKINYTITAISSIAVAQTTFRTFTKRTAKPSSIIYDLLYNSGELSTNLLDIFPGMRNRTLVASKGLIPSNDAEVSIGGMNNVSPVTYLSYLVACMSNSNKSTYYLSIVDDSLSDFGGSYFKINEITSYKNEQISDFNFVSSYYELDIGFPSNNYITNFQICNDNYWSLVYDYAGDISKFEYGIDDTGNITRTQTNILYKTNKYSESSIISANWWKQVTEFPITAKVTLKGLISPAILMSYIKINALFYGQRDMASGLYVVTAQEDNISGSGYTTELTLLRVAGE